MFKKKFKKSNSRKYVENMCMPPNSQISEVLYELMCNYNKGMTRIELSNACHVLNVPEIIRRLRQRNCIVNIDMIKKVNKYGRDIKYGRYYLGDFKNAVEVYSQLPKESEKETEK